MSLKNSTSYFASGAKSPKPVFTASACKVVFGKTPSEVAETKFLLPGCTGVGGSLRQAENVIATSNNPLRDLIIFLISIRIILRFYVVQNNDKPGIITKKFVRAIKPLIYILHFRPLVKFHINFNHEYSLEIFKLQKWLVIIVIILATRAQLLTRTDPIIFGKIIDNWAINLKNLRQSQLVNGVLYWLGIAIALAVAAGIAKVFQQCLTRQAVQQFGIQIFKDGLKQTLRWCFQEYEEQSSGVLQQRATTC
jgi:hypothetical protein